MKPEYIFISGVSRTGSTLLVQILNSSSEVAIARENWYLGHQIPWEGIRYAIKRNFGHLSKETNIDRLVEFLYTGRFKRNNDGYWLWLRKNTQKEEFLEKLLKLSAIDDRAIFQTMMQVFGEWLHGLKSDTSNNIILGEKTPSHIYYVPTLLKWFPNSKVVHTFRDPRAIYASELRRRRLKHGTFPYNLLHCTGFFFNLFILFQVTYTWYRASRLHLKYRKIYQKRYFVQNFENLVIDPEKSIKKLCSFLDITFSDEMLRRRVVSLGFKHGQNGFDHTAAYRWQNVNSRWANKWFSTIFSKYLKQI